MSRLAFALALAALFPAAATAQRAASPFLPAQHWAHVALRDLEMRGAVGTEALDAGTRSTTVLHAIETFARAASNEHVDERVRARAEAYAGLLRDEYGEDEHARRGYAVRSGAEFDHHDGRVAAGDGYYPEDRTGARPRDAIDAGAARFGLDGRSGAFAFTVDGVIGESSTLDEVQAVGRIRDLQVWAGRRAHAYGPGSESIVINSDVAFDGAGLALVHPVRFPSFFRGQGRLNIEGYVARMDQVGVIDNPWFLGARLSYAPHPRFTVGINRGAVFGGDDNAPVTATNLVRLMFGLYSGDASNFENQIIAFDMRYRVPKVPLVVYYEWGMDDGSGAWLDVPGIVAGATVPLAIGGSPVDITVERTSFAESCCGNPIWYRHHRFMGSWASDGVMIGHPIGGEGTELAAAVNVASARGKVRGRVRGFVRDRGEENVFAPERAGGSTGGEIELTVRANSRLELELDAGTEHGDGDWTETRILIGGRVRLMHGR